MSTIINHPGWDEDPWEIELHEAPTMGRDGYTYTDATPTHTAQEQPLRDDFGWGIVEDIGNLLETIAVGVGEAIEGAANFAGGAFTAVLDGINNFISGIAGAIASIFKPDEEAEIPTYLNPIKTNLEAALQPMKDDIEKSNQRSEELFGELGRVREDFDEKLGESGEVGQSIVNLSEEMRNKVNSETFTNYQESLQEQLWGEQGDINQLNSAMWDEQGEFNTLQNDLWTEQGRVDDLQTELSKENARVTALHSEMLENQQEFISRTMFLRPLAENYDDYIFVKPVSDVRWEVEALDNWVGEYTLQGARYSDDNGAFEPVIDFRTVPNDDPVNSRLNYHNGNNYSTIITYWVRTSEYKESIETLSDYYNPNQNVISRVHSLDFEAPVDGDYAVHFELTWDAATYDDAYGIRVLVNGVTKIMRSATRVGPLLPFESGVRNWSVSETEIPLKEGDLVTFHVLSAASESSQRMIQPGMWRKIHWVEEPTDKNA